MHNNIQAKNDDFQKIYVVIASSPAGDERQLRGFADTIASDAIDRLQDQTGLQWQYHLGDTFHLETTEARRADDFLREAFLRMVQHSCDLVLVITDVSLVSESKYIVPGLAAPEAQVAVISTQKLISVPAGEPVRDLQDKVVCSNAIVLLLHLVGHIFHLPHQQKGVMAPFEFDEERRQPERFSEVEQRALTKAADQLAVREVPVKGTLSILQIHLKALFQNPKDVLRIAWRSKALFLPLSLTKLTTAAIAPAILMFFTDEFWWVGIHRADNYIWSAAAVAVLISTMYIPFSQDLLFPHRERRVITSNVASANLGMLLSIFLMVIGLFLLVSLVILILEVWLFPPELIDKWFDGFDLQVTWYDHFKIAVVVGTLGTLTGALGSGFQGREIIRAVSFFRKET